MSSDILTIGSALRRAENLESFADVLIEGQWLVGKVDRVEGDSAVLVGDDGDEIVMRLSSISAVRVRGSVPDTPSAAGAGGGINVGGAGTALDAMLARRGHS